MNNDYLYIIAGCMFWVIVAIFLCALLIFYVATLVKKNNKIQKEQQELLKEISEKQNAIMAEFQIFRGYNPYNNYQKPQYYNDNKRNF